MNKKGIVALILIILVVTVIADFRFNGIGVLGSYFQQLDPDFLGEARINDNLEESDLPRTSKPGSMTVDRKDLAQLQLDNPRGDIEITGRRQEQIEVEYTITVYGATEQLAREFSDQVQVKYKYNEDQLIIGRKLPPHPDGIKGVEVDYQITAPQDMKLQLAAKYGKLDAANFTKPANLAVKYGEIRVNDLQAGAVIVGKYCEGKITNIADKLEIDSKYSGLKLRQIAAATQIDNKYGGLELADIAGNIKLDSAYAGVEATNLTGKLTGELAYGAITIEEVINSIDVESEYGAVNLKLSPQLTNYSLDIIANQGDINTNLDLPLEKEGDQIKLQTSNSGQVQIKVRTKQGAVEIND